MITAVDTNVLLDVLIPNAPHGERSELALSEATHAGTLVISEAAYAEMAAFFPQREQLDLFLDDTNIRLDRSRGETLALAGRAWRSYRDHRPTGLICPQCGQAHLIRCESCGRSLAPRQHIMTDFLIGAHALVQAQRLLTRDRGYYSTYFPQLSLML